MAKRIDTTVTLVTFGLFMIEAIMHYNMGANANKEDKTFTLPPTKDLLKLGVVVGTFSVINGVIINHIKNK